MTATADTTFVTTIDAHPYGFYDSVRHAGDVVWDTGVNASLITWSGRSAGCAGEVDRPGTDSTTRCWARGRRPPQPLLLKGDDHARHHRRLHLRRGRRAHDAAAADPRPAHRRDGRVCQYKEFSDTLHTYEAMDVPGIRGQRKPRQSPLANVTRTLAGASIGDAPED